MLNQLKELLPTNLYISLVADIKKFNIDTTEQTEVRGRTYSMYSLGDMDGKHITINADTYNVCDAGGPRGNMKTLVIVIGASAERKVFKPYYK